MIASLILAAGRGTRAATPTPKQYVELNGKTVLARTVERFLAVPRVDSITVVIGREDTEAYENAVSVLDDKRLTPPVIGGETRLHSVQAGLAALVKADPDHVLVHDAARPFVETAQIEALIEALQIHDSAFLAVPSVDALWRTDGGFAISPVDRTTIWRAQTPQGFRFQKFLAAHRSFNGTAADDVEVARAAGILAKIIESTEANFKITTPEDIDRARARLATKNR